MLVNNAGIASIAPLLNADVDEMEGLGVRLSDAETLYELAVEEDDESVTNELEGLVDKRMIFSDLPQVSEIAGLQFI